MNLSPNQFLPLTHRWSANTRDKMAKLTTLVEFFIDKFYTNSPIPFSELVRQILQNQSYTSSIVDALEPVLPLLSYYLFDHFSRKILSQVCDRDLIDIFYHHQTGEVKSVRQINWNSLIKWLRIFSLNDIFDKICNLNTHLTFVLKYVLGVSEEHLQKIIFPPIGNVFVEFDNAVKKYRLSSPLISVDEDKFCEVYSYLFANLAIVHVRMVNTFGSNILPLYSNTSAYDLPIYSLSNIYSYGLNVEEDVLYNVARDSVLQAAFWRVIVEQCIKPCLGSDYNRVLATIAILAQTIINFNCYDTHINDVRNNITNIVNFTKNYISQLHLQELPYSLTDILFSFKTFSKAIYRIESYFVTLNIDEICHIIATEYGFYYTAYARLMDKQSPPVLPNIQCNIPLTNNEVKNYKENYLKFGEQFASVDFSKF